MAKLFCCHCQINVDAIKLTGKDVYPHRNDLYHLVLWGCPNCYNHVGCHRGTDTPLGSIPTRQLRGIRKDLHKFLDPLWQSKKFTRTEVYFMLTRDLGYTYHTGNVNSVTEARVVYQLLVNYGQLK